MKGKREDLLERARKAYKEDWIDAYACLVKQSGQGEEIIEALVCELMSAESRARTGDYVIQKVVDRVDDIDPELMESLFEYHFERDGSRSMLKVPRDIRALKSGDNFEKARDLVRLQTPLFTSWDDDSKGVEDIAWLSFLSLPESLQSCIKVTSTPVLYAHDQQVEVDAHALYDMTSFSVRDALADEKSRRELAAFHADKFEGFITSHIGSHYGPLDYDDVDIYINRMVMTTDNSSDAIKVGFRGAIVIVTDSEVALYEPA